MAWPLPCPQRFNQFTITYHAMKRFYKRYMDVHPELSQEQKDSVEFFYGKFTKHLKSAVEVERNNSAWQEIKYNTPARYLRSKKGHGRWIFIVSNENYVLTVTEFQPCKAKMYKKKVDIS